MSKKREACRAWGIVSMVALSCVAPWMARGEGDPGSLSELADLDLAALLEIEIPLVVGASKYEQKVTEAPSAVTIVTADDIRVHGYRTLADVLRSVPGFYITYDRTYAFIGARGFSRPGDYGGRILLLLDGHRLNDPIYDTAAAATDFILDVDLVDRVEVIRGPGSALYGNNAFFAVINVRTRRPAQREGVEIAASAGRYEAYQGRGTYAHVSSNGVEVLVSATAQDRHGVDRLYVPEFDAEAMDQDGEQYHSVFGTVKAKDLSFSGAFLERDKDVPNAPYGTIFGDPRYAVYDNRAYAELKYEHALRDAGSLMARTYYNHYVYEADYPYEVAEEGAPPLSVLNRDEQKAQSLGVELQVSQTLGDQHHVIAGVEYRDDMDLELNNFDVEPPFVYQKVSADNQVAAVYLQDEYRCTEEWLFNVGLRLDSYADFGETLNPRLAAIWDPIEGTTLKAIGGSAFRAPNAYERLYTTNVNAPNPNLDPETIQSFELIWEQAVGSNLRTSMSAFHNSIDDLINQTEDAEGNQAYRNQGGATSYGLEPTLHAQWANGWRGRAGYTYARAEDDEGARLDNSPAHLGKLGVVVPLYRDRLSAGIEAQYTAERRAPNGEQIDDFAVANVTLLTQKLWRDWEVSASVYNLFDTEYSDPTDTTPARVEQEGREWRVKVTTRF